MKTNKVSNSRTRPRPLTPWELPSLLTPGYTYRRTKRKEPKDRLHYPAVLGFVYRNRFAVASQVQRRFAQYLPSGRTARRHLEEMQLLDYLAVAPSRSTGPLWPKVYYVTGRGVRKLRDSLAAQGKPWQAVRIDRSSRHSAEGYSSEHVLHEILITEFMLAVWQTVRARHDVVILTIQRRSLARHPDFEVVVDGRRTRLVPDSMFLFRQSDGGMMCCFVELDTGTMNLKQIRTKYRRYEAWSQSEAGQSYLTDLYRRHGAKNPRPTFRILVISRDRTGTNDIRRLRAVAAPFTKKRGPISRRIWFTTVEDLCLHQNDPLPLQAAIWYCMVDGPSHQSKDSVTTRSSLTRQSSPCDSEPVFSGQRHLLFPKPPTNPTVTP